jgi:predicted GNAT family acetyltransferase
MTDSDLLYFTCSLADLEPVDTTFVRWLNPMSEYPLAQRYWASFDQTLRHSTWQKAHEFGYQYAAMFEGDWLVACAAVWRFSNDAWEVSGVSTLPDYRRQGRSRRTVAFVTTYILEAGRLATTSAQSSNQAAIATALSVGFKVIPPEQVWWQYPHLPEF